MTPFLNHPGALGFRLDRSEVLLFREKETGVFGTITGCRLIRDPHPLLLLSAMLYVMDKRGVEAGAVEKVFVPLRDVVNSIVFPNGLRAVRTVDWDVGAW